MKLYYIEVTYKTGNKKLLLMKGKKISEILNSLDNELANDKIPYEITDCIFIKNI